MSDYFFWRDGKCIELTSEEAAEIAKQYAQNNQQNPDIQTLNVLRLLSTDVNLITSLENDGQGHNQISISFELPDKSIQDVCLIKPSEDGGIELLMWADEQDEDYTEKTHIIPFMEDDAILELGFDEICKLLSVHGKNVWNYAPTTISIGDEFSDIEELKDEFAFNPNFREKLGCALLNTPIA